MRFAKIISTPDKGDAGLRDRCMISLTDTIHNFKTYL